MTRVPIRASFRKAVVLAVVGATAVAGLASHLQAQRTETELAKMRADHEKGLATACRLIDDIHRLTLRQLERERAEAGDYETAARVKARLDTLDQHPGVVAITPPPLTHVLPAARALTRDGANTEGGREYIDFRRAGGKAVWDLLGLERGTYEVFLTYAVGLPRYDESALGESAGGPREVPGGRATFSEVTGLGGGTPVVLEKRILTTGAWENYIRESLGRYDFRNATATVKLEAAEATDGGLMRVRQIELVKVAGESPSSAPSTEFIISEPMRTLQELRGRHRRNLREITESLHPRFAGEALKLENELKAGGDTRAAAAVARFRQSLSPPASAPEEDTTEELEPLPGLADDPNDSSP